MIYDDDENDDDDHHHYYSPYLSLHSIYLSIYLFYFQCHQQMTWWWGSIFNEIFVSLFDRLMDW